MTVQHKLPQDCAGSGNVKFFGGTQDFCCQGPTGCGRVFGERPVAPTLTETLTWLRAKGWMVGAHNDYFVAGMRYTFWLFTNRTTGRFLKGEAPTDETAVSLVADQVRTIT